MEFCVLRTVDVQKFFFFFRAIDECSNIGIIRVSKRINKISFVFRFVEKKDH